MHFKRALVLIAVFAVPAAAWACGSISDADQRYFCYGNCGSISNADQRYYCYAVKSRSGSCGSISDSDLRYRCYAETR